MNILTKLTLGWFILLLTMKLVKTIADFINEGVWFPNFLQLFIFLIFLSFIASAIYGLVKNKLSGFYFSIGINAFLAIAGALGLVSQIYILTYPEVYLSEPVFWTLLIQCLISTAFTFSWLNKGKFGYKKT